LDTFQRLDELSRGLAPGQHTFAQEIQENDGGVDDRPVAIRELSRTSWICLLPPISVAVKKGDYLAFSVFRYLALTTSQIRYWLVSRA
jgi:hypothetical protein